MSDFEVSSETKSGVQYEDVLEMLGGYNYFSQAQIMYIYLKLSFQDEEAEVYLQQSLAEAKQIHNNFYNKMKTQEEIDEINKQIVKFPNHKILLQTDDIKVQNYLNVYYKEKVFYFSEIEPSKSKIGSHNLSKKDPILFTQTYLATVLILSESEILITHTGNGALWEFIIRNKFNLSNKNSIYQL